MTILFAVQQLERCGAQGAGFGERAARGHAALPAAVKFQHQVRGARRIDFLTVNGSNFVNGAQVKWNGTPLTTSFNSSAKLTATGTAAQTGSVSTVANPGPGAVSAAASINVVSTLLVNVAPANISLQPNVTQLFQATVSGSANQAVTWKVVGGDGYGTITTAGLYTAPSAVPPSGTVTVCATAAADGVTQGTATATLQDPLAITYGRFLDQSTFGPTPQLIAHAQQVGMPAFIDEQFGLPESAWPARATRSNAIDAFFGNASSGQDQLRQCVIFALSEIIVIALNKNTNGDEIVPWLQLLSRNAFGNYRTLLKELTLDAAMGKYLDLANSGVVNAANNALLYGRMLPATRTALLAALPAMSDNYQRVLTVLYLTATSGEHLVQH
jgi:hypothetical protein